MTWDDMPVEGKPVTWRYVAGVLLEAAILFAVGAAILAATAVLGDYRQDFRHHAPTIEVRP